MYRKLFSVIIVILCFCCSINAFAHGGDESIAIENTPYLCVNEVTGPEIWKTKGDSLTKQSTKRILTFSKTNLRKLKSKLAQQRLRHGPKYKIKRLVSEVKAAQTIMTQIKECLAGNLFHEHLPVPTPSAPLPSPTPVATPGVTTTPTTTQLITYQAILNGAQAVPANNSSATGLCELQVNPAAESVTVGCVHNVVDATQVHMHVSLGNSTYTCFFPNTSSFTGVVCGLTNEVFANLLAGKGYLVVHSKLFPAGEIRTTIPAEIFTAPAE